jgi:hypothetical protein
VLAVAASAHALAAIPRDEDTLSRGLRTFPLPGTHASVADCWQNNRCCHLLPKSNTVSATPPCRTRTKKFTRRGHSRADDIGDPECGNGPGATPCSSLITLTGDASSIVITTVPRLKEGHVIARLHFNGPGIIFLFGFANDKPESGSKAIDREGRHLDAIIGDITELA